MKVSDDDTTLMRQKSKHASNLKWQMKAGIVQLSSYTNRKPEYIQGIKMSTNTGTCASKIEDASSGGFQVARMLVENGVSIKLVRGKGAGKQFKILSLGIAATSLI